MKRLLINKETRFANDEELNLIYLNHVNILKTDDETIKREGFNLELLNIKSEDDEIQAYLEAKNNILYVIRIDLTFNTKEIVTFFDVFYLYQNVIESTCYDNTTDMENDVNSFVDKKGNYDKYTMILKYEGDKFKDVTEDDLIFTPNRLEAIIN